MYLRGENWEHRIYPLLSTPYARCARAILPQSAIVTAAETWLCGGHSVFKAPYFAAVDRAASLALPDRSGVPFLRAHLRFMADFYLSMIAMIESRRSSIKARLAGRVRLQLSGLEAALATGRGVLMPTVQTSVPFRMIFSDFPKSGRYNVIMHRQSGILQMLEKADPFWKFLFLEDTPGRQILEALKRNEVVLCNIDHAYPGTEVTLAPVLGHTAIVPSGAFRVARRYNALVVPLIFTEEDDTITISAEQVFDWSETDELAVAAMLARVQPVLDKAILRAPERWFGWGNLLQRWQAWKALLPREVSP